MTDTLRRPDGASVRDEASARHRSGVSRDSSVDAIRVVLLVVVFALHAMMFGVTMGPDGPVLENALEHQTWFGPVSWVVQIMPLFFIAGGFSSFHHWRSMRSRGATGAEYVRTRLGRLVRPAIAVVVVVAAGLVALAAAGVPADVVATAGFRIGQPLWFLAVYVGLSALVPLMVRAHERARVLTPLALLAAVVAVDVTRLSTGVEAIGLANLLLVWLLVQQLGFHLADGGLDLLSRRTLWAIAGGALALLAVLTVVGPYSVDMYENLNPPTVGLVVLGVSQLALFQLARPGIRTLVGRADASRTIAAIGERAMTVYLWHMPVLVALAGVLLVANATFGFALPEPLTFAWWASRPLWLAVGAIAVVPAVLLFARFERARRMPRGRPAAASAVWPEASGATGASGASGASAWWTALDAVCGVGGVAVVLVMGFGPAQAVTALVLLVIALPGSRASSRAMRAAVHRIRGRRRMAVVAASATVPVAAAAAAAAA